MTKCRFKYIICGILMILGAGFGVLRAAPVSSIDGCHDIEFIYVRASGQERYKSDDWPIFKAAVDSRFKNSGLTYGVDDLGYPAVSISPELLPLVLVKNAGFYNTSVRSGVKNLKAKVATIKKTCPKTKFAFAGFSQGAQVVSTAVLELRSEDILYAATMGDPKLYLPEGGKSNKGQALPDACYGENLSTYRVNVADCKAREGWLGGRKPYTSAALMNKVGAWCADGDPICSGQVTATLSKSFKRNWEDIKKSIGKLVVSDLRRLPSDLNDLTYSIFQAHDSYHKTGAYEEATDMMLSRAATLWPELQLLTVEPMRKTATDLAILIDMVNFDTPIVKRYATAAKKLAKKTFQKGGHVAIYEMFNSTYEPTVQVCDFACSEEEVEASLDDMVRITYTASQHNPRSVLWSSLQMMNQLSWHKGYNKSLVVFTHESYLNPDIDGVSLNDVIKRSYEIDPVNFYIVADGENMEGYGELAELTGGMVLGIGDDLGIIVERPASVILPENTETEEFDFELFSKLLEDVVFKMEKAKTVGVPTKGLGVPNTGAR